MRSAAFIDKSEQIDLDGPGGVMRISIAQPFPPDPSLSLMDQREKPIPVFVLDANLLFGLAVSVTRMMQFGGHVPPCLVVGVGYPEVDLDTFSKRRTLDLTPTAWHSSHSGSQEQSGGGPAMLDFIQRSVLGVISERYDCTYSESVLFGLSYGGLLSLHAYVERPDEFPHHIALSPSLHWDSGAVTNALEGSLLSGQARRGRLYVAAGAREMEISPPTEPTMARDIQMVQRVVTVGNLLAEHPSLVSRVEVIPDESHHTIAAPGLVRGLRYTIGDFATT